MGKKLISILLALTMLLGIAAAAPFTASSAESEDTVGAKSGKTGDCTWSLSGTALTIKGYGAMADYPYDYSEKTPWGYDITSVEIFPGVTRIGNYAFKFCEKLESVTIGDNVESIGKSAFSTCKSLKEITIPDSVTEMEDAVFWYCTGLESIKLPARMDSFGSSMFNACSKLKRVDLPEGLTTVPYEAFFWCRNLEVINVPSTLTSVSMRAFTACYGVKELKLPESVTIIGSEAFSYCYALERVNIPSGVTEIGTGTFQSCTSLTRLDIPEGVTSIGDDAFRDCETLAAINIPESVEEIGDGVFNGTAWLKKQPDGAVYFKNSVVACGGECPAEITLRRCTDEIKGFAFEGCAALKKINIPTTVKRIGRQAFSGCTSLTDVKIPDAVTVIEKGVFNGCSSLRRLDLHDGITEIGEEAFRDCSALESVYMPDSVTSLKLRAYYNCDALASLRLSEGLTNLGGNGNYAAELFKDCDSLQSVVIPNSISYVYDSFNECDSLEKVLLCDPDAQYRSSFYSSAQGGTATIYRLGSSGDCSVTYDSNTLTVSGKGKTADYTEEEPAPWSLFPDFAELVTSVVAEEGVTGIGDNAFRGLPNLGSITLPDTVGQIGAHAFEDTAWYDSQPDGLVYLGTALLGFKGESTQGVWIKSDTLLIASDAFRRAEKLRSATLPDGVEKIGKNAFADCAELTSVTVPESVTEIGKGAFKNSPNLRLKCFDGSKALTYAKDNGIPYDVIGGKTGDCRWRAEGSRLIISGNGKMKDYSGSWNGSAPWGTGFTEVVIEEGVTGIGGTAFSKLSKLEKVVIPESVTSFPSALSSPFPSKTKLTVYGYEGSKAQKYISDNSWSFKDYVTFKALGDKGDVEIDGAINVRDVTAVQKAVAEVTDLTERQNAAADANGDGEVNIEDATLIQMYISELIDSLG